MPIELTQQMLAQRWTVREGGEANTYTISVSDDWLMQIRMNGRPWVSQQLPVVKAVATLPEILVALRDATDRLRILVDDDRHKSMDAVALHQAEALLKRLDLTLPKEIP